MRATVNFNDDPFRTTRKVREVHSNRHLPDKFEPVDLSITQRVPRLSFRRYLPWLRPAYVALPNRHLAVVEDDDVAVDNTGAE